MNAKWGDSAFNELIRRETAYMAKALRLDLEQPIWGRQIDEYDRHVRDVIRARYMRDEVPLEDAVRGMTL